MKAAALCLALGALGLNATYAAEVIPPAPQHYFNDYARIVSQSAAEGFDRQLRQFEIETSNQVVVAIFPKMQSDDDLPAYTQRVFDAWRVGQKDRRNGVVLFVFVEDRKMFIQVGYGLEGALPDLSAFNITENQIKPHFVSGDYEGGLRVGIDAICKAIGGEYKGTTHQFVADGKRTHRAIGPLFFLIVFFILSLLSGIHRTGQRGHLYSSNGQHWTFSWGDFFFFWLTLLLSGRGGGGGSSSSSSGGGFSGGGGSSGGGGAGSSW